MGKTKVLSIRTTEEMSDALNVLAQCYKQDIQDIYRIALSEFIVKSQDIIRNFNSRFKFRKLPLNQWTPINNESFVKWNETDHGQIEIGMIGILTQGLLSEIEYVLPLSKEEVFELLTDEDCIKSDTLSSDNGEIKIEKWVISEEKLIETICFRYGKECKNYKVKNDTHIKEVLKTNYAIIKQ